MKRAAPKSKPRATSAQPREAAAPSGAKQLPLCVAPRSARGAAANRRNCGEAYLPRSERSERQGEAEGFAASLLAAMPPIPSKAPPPIAAWARKCLFISARQGTARPGFYDTAKTPYILEPLQAMADPAIRRVTLCFGSQTGKTQALIAALAYLWRWAPGPTMVVQPAIDEAKTFGETRLKPTLEDSEELRQLLPHDRKGGYKKDFYALRGSLVYLIGAGSPSKMASKPCRYTILDETDKFPAEFTAEGDPIKLIEQRTKTYQGRQKELFTSTPTLETGVIWRQFKQGDRREFFIQCEHCKAWQPIAFGDIKFDNDKTATARAIAKTARLVCRSCGAPHDTHAKNRMVAKGHWQPTAEPELDATRSYHLPSFAAPWISLEYIVQHFIEAKRAGRTQLRAFVNGELAEPWIEEQQNLLNTDLARLELDYGEGQSFPARDASALAEDRIRIVGADVQIDRLVAVCREFARGGESGLVSKWEPHTWTDFLDFLNATHANAAFVDARYRTKEVLDFAAKNPGIVPAYGSSRLGGALQRTAYIDRTGGKVHTAAKDKICTVTYDQSKLFDLVADGLAGRGPGWWLYRGAAEDTIYTSQLLAKKTIAGIWTAPHGTDDHFADAEKLAMLGALVLGYL